MPEGLGGSDSGPNLPAGLGEEKDSNKEKKAEEQDEKWRENLPVDLIGFLEARGGLRTQSDPYERDVSLGELRFQIEAQRLEARWAAEIVADLLFDPVLDEYDIDLEDGSGWIDVRRANISLVATDFLDLKLGRQILTWGTGDLVFINDLFPKDWNSFFIGRDPEYLKAPSDAVKGSVYTDWMNLDLVYTPRFDPDRYIDGSRISYWSPALGRRAGQDAVSDANLPEDWFTDDEWAFRAFRNLSGYELALYAYLGRWKSPAGSDMDTGQAVFPELNVYGASVRGNLAKGIAHAELGIYDSKEDREGSDPAVRNGEWRFLLGYEQEVAKEFTVGIQYYLERMMDYGAYLASIPVGIEEADQDRHWVTLRLTKLLFSQNMTLSCFAFYSPSEEDSYFLPKVQYKVNDQWTAEVAGNIFAGKKDHTFLGQFERNSNLYVGARYSF